MDEGWFTQSQTPTVSAQLFHQHPSASYDVWHRGLVYPTPTYRNNIQNPTGHNNSFSNYTYFTLPNKNSYGGATSVPELYQPSGVGDGHHFVGKRASSKDEDGSDLMFLSQTSAQVYPWMKLEGN